MAPNGKSTTSTTTSSSLLQIFGISVLQVTSSTRARWSEDELTVFRNFAAQFPRKPLATSNITPLLHDLKLDRFAVVYNVHEDLLGPIIEVKVRRKLQNVWMDMASTSDLKPSYLLGAAANMPKPMEKTRLQILRADAISRKEDPPTKLPAPPEIYIPDPWPVKSRRHGRGKGQSSKLSTSVAIAEARKEVARLEKALQAARARFAELEQAQILLDDDTEDDIIAAVASSSKQAVISTPKSKSKSMTVPITPDSELDEDDEDDEDDQEDPSPLNDNGQASKSRLPFPDSPAPTRLQHARSRRITSVPMLDPAPAPKSTTSSSRVAAKSLVPAGKKPQTIADIEKKSRRYQQAVEVSSSDSEDTDTLSFGWAEEVSGWQVWEEGLRQ